jgi:cytochrome c556
VQCPPAPAASSSPGDAAATLDAGAPPNVVQTEMRLLTQILEATVRGIGANDVRGIDEQLHQLHAAKEATGAAVKSGAYKLPKNADQVAQFEAMDEAFHAHLGSLVKASSKNDVPGAAEALSQIVRGCPSCHAVFRP